MTNHPVYDVASIGLIVGALAGWLPPLAAGMGVIWYSVLLYDRFIGKRGQ